jgi:hypothetical protein
MNSVFDDILPTFRVANLRFIESAQPYILRDNRCDTFPMYVIKIRNVDRSANYKHEIVHIHC